MGLRDHGRRKVYPDHLAFGHQPGHLLELPAGTTSCVQDPRVRGDVSLHDLERLVEDRLRERPDPLRIRLRQLLEPFYQMVVLGPFLEELWLSVSRREIGSEAPPLDKRGRVSDDLVGNWQAEAFEHLRRQEYVRRIPPHGPQQYRGRDVSRGETG